MTTFLSSFYIFLDVETTGFDPIRNDVTSIGVVVTDHSHVVLSEFYTTVKPEINKFTSEDALIVSGFSKETLLSHKPQREACIDFMKFLKPYLETFPQKMISHTVNGFDWRFVDWLFRKQELNYNLYKVIGHENQESTIKIARELGYSNNKLSDWGNRLSISFEHHNALEDAKMCYMIHKQLTKKE